MRKYITIQNIIFSIVMLLLSPTTLFAQRTAVIAKETLNTAMQSIVAIETTKVAYTNPYHNSNMNIFSDPFWDNGTTNEESYLPQGNGLRYDNGIGTGIIIKEENERYYIVTNNHVIHNNTHLWVTTHDGTIHKGTFLASNAIHDIGIITISSNISTPIRLATLGDSKKIEIGETVYAVGNPYGFQFTVTQGIISGLNRSVENINNIFIQTDASLNPGNSGGAILNTLGEIVGISTWIFSPGRRIANNSINVGLNFAVSINKAKKLINMLLKNGSIDRGWIGLTILPVSAKILHSMNISYRNAAIVDNVFVDDIAYASGIHVGDTIIAINDNPLYTDLYNDFNSIFSQISTTPPGNNITITVIRDNAPINIHVTTQQRPSERTIINNAQTIWPGVSGIPLPDYLKEVYGIKQNKFSILLKNVISHSPAHQAAIQEADIIRKIDGNAITSYQQYIALLNDALKNQKMLTLQIFRKGKNIVKTLSPPPLNNNNQ